MSVYIKLKKLRAFEKSHLPALVTLEDFEIVRTIGEKQESGEYILLKQLYLEGIGTIATVTRRLERLRGAGLIVGLPFEGDKRSVQLTISPGLHRIFLQYGKLIESLGQ